MKGFGKASRVTVKKGGNKGKRRGFLVEGRSWGVETVGIRVAIEAERGVGEGGGNQLVGDFGQRNELMRKV